MLNVQNVDHKRTQSQYLYDIRRKKEEKAKYIKFQRVKQQLGGDSLFPSRQIMQKRTNHVLK